MSRRTRALILGCAALVLGGGVRAGDDAAALVAAMSQALRTLNYEGTFVHLQGSTVSSMHIVHANDGRGERERMTSLDGEAREVIRDHSLVTCIWPGSGAVVRSKSRPRRLLPNVDAALARNPSYVFALAGTDRVAGLATDVVEIRSRDGYRYGYRFWIDSATRMLLRSMLLDGERTVEQVMFTSIAYPESIDLARFEVDVDEDHVRWVEPVGARARAGSVPDLELPGLGSNDGRDTFAELDALRTKAPEASAENGAGDATTASARVRFETLPNGYRTLSANARKMGSGDAPLTHVMVSDGMASVSVYVDHLPAGEQDTSVAGFSSMGAMNAYGLSLDSGFVTVVGEVPADTVRAIAEAVRLLD